MPSRPEKSVSMYQAEQVEEYQQAISHLKEQGKISDDTSQGEKLATLSREYLDTSKPQDSSNTGLPWRDLGSLVLGIGGVVVFVGVILVILVAVVYFVAFGGNMPF